jgi:hypothetical protein
VQITQLRGAGGRQGQAPKQESRSLGRNALKTSIQIMHFLHSSIVEPDIVQLQHLPHLWVNETK